MRDNEKDQNRVSPTIKTTAYSPCHCSALSHQPYNVHSLFASTNIAAMAENAIAFLLTGLTRIPMAKEMFRSPQSTSTTIHVAAGLSMPGEGSWASTGGNTQASRCSTKTETASASRTAPAKARSATAITKISSWTPSTVKTIVPHPTLACLVVARTSSA